MQIVYLVQVGQVVRSVRRFRIRSAKTVHAPQPCVDAMNAWRDSEAKGSAPKGIGPLSRLETEGPGDESGAVSRYLGSPLFEVTFQSIPAVMTLVEYRRGYDGYATEDQAWAIIERRAHQLVPPQYRVPLLPHRSP